MGSNKALFLLAILGGALGGAGGFWAAEHFCRRPEPVAAPVPAPAPAPVLPPVTSADMAKLEARPGPEETPKPSVPGDKPVPPALGPRMPAVASPRPAQPPAPVTDYRRMEMAAEHRAEYERLLGEIQGVLKADAARWNEIRTAFDKHFAPVESALKDLEAGKTSAPPKVNELVRPGLPATLETIR